MNNNKRKFVSLGLIILGGILVGVAIILLSIKKPLTKTTWKFQSIDTMKYSRDVAREKLGSKKFDVVIDKQVKEIADTGATHIALATPYDEEFLAFLKRWVKTARKYNLKVWFRGNFSGWEGWFDYSKMTRDEHLKKTQDFIINNVSLFENGDVFTACPECENGGPGDPRMNGDVEGHRKFLIDEYKVTKAAFGKINKNVASNYDSMNMDVAKTVMDAPTTAALDGIVTVDHYVKTPELLKSDIDFVAAQSGGKVVLGEFGAPIPDITGDMTDSEQSAWLLSVLNLLKTDSNVIGLNYWVGEGGSTELWNSDGTAKPAVNTLKSIYIDSQNN